GEFDMVVADSETLSCEIYEVKYSTEVVEKQYQHLIDEEKCKDTEFRYGKIKNKYVIYRGETTEVNGIKYVNTEEYLKSLA
ncbi:MAG: ATP-binding protein, partial [Clostridia bacterium]|nr:ATP-binding protein [Clostridia bacterium]